MQQCLSKTGNSRRFTVPVQEPHSYSAYSPTFYIDTHGCQLGMHALHSAANLVLHVLPLRDINDTNEAFTLVRTVGSLNAC